MDIKDLKGHTRNNMCEVIILTSYHRENEGYWLLDVKFRNDTLIPSQSQNREADGKIKAGVRRSCEQSVSQTGGFGRIKAVPNAHLVSHSLPGIDSNGRTRRTYVRAYSDSEFDAISRIFDKVEVPYVDSLGDKGVVTSYIGKAVIDFGVDSNTGKSNCFIKTGKGQLAKTDFPVYDRQFDLDISRASSMHNVKSRKLRLEKAAFDSTKMKQKKEASAEFH